MDQTDYTIGICGIGQMGAAAAVAFRRAGYRVLLWARNAAKLEAVQETLDTLEQWLDDHVGPVEACGQIERVTELDRVAREADVFMDAIAENMAQKTDLFRSLNRPDRPETIFITTTSGLSISELGQQSGTSSRLAGTHFWNPPHLMPLVEVVRGDQTPNRVIDQVCALIESIGKVPVRVEKDIPGFIGNRMLHALWREAMNLIQQGVATPADIDRVARLTFGLRMPAVGPLENMDLVGLDLIETIHQYLPADLCNEPGPLEVLTDSVARDDLGIKTGRGFYDWSERDPQALIDARDNQIVDQIAYLKKSGML
jgi:3-hydroxybutyryl-CoA dehydrogenase